jgi:ParB/RepB/Spo0J family partition protein
LPAPAPPPDRRPSIDQPLDHHEELSDAQPSGFAAADRAFAARCTRLPPVVFDPIVLVSRERALPMTHDSPSRPLDTPLPRGPILPIPLADLDPSPVWARLVPLEADEGLGALVRSIAEDGFRGCIEVRPDPKGRPGRYQIVAGHRRVEAARLAGLTSVPAQVATLSDDQMRRRWIRENLLRADLTPWEEAAFLLGLREKGMTYDEIAEEVGKDPAWVRGRLDLPTLVAARPEAAWDADTLPDILTALWALEPHEREPLRERLRSGELSVGELSSLVAARRTTLRRLVSTVSPPGSRQSGDPDQDADALEATAPARRHRRTVAENPADNPEGIAAGWTVDNGVATWADLARQLEEHPTNRETARALARNIAIDRLTPPPTPIGEAPGWRGTEPEILRTEDQAAAPPTLAQKQAANRAFLRVVAEAGDAIRQAVERTHPGLLTPEERRVFRALRQDLADLTVVVT